MGAGALMVEERYVEGGRCECEAGEEVGHETHSEENNADLVSNSDASRSKRSCL